MLQSRLLLLKREPYWDLLVDKGRQLPAPVKDRASVRGSTPNLPDGARSMANGNDRAQTTIVAGRAEKIAAQIAAIKANGGTLISVRIVKQDAHSGTFDVEITHS